MARQYSKKNASIVFWISVLLFLVHIVVAQNSTTPLSPVASVKTKPYKINNRVRQQISLQSRKNIYANITPRERKVIDIASIYPSRGGQKKQKQPRKKQEVPNCAICITKSCTTEFCALACRTMKCAKPPAEESKRNCFRCYTDCAKSNQISNDEKDFQKCKLQCYHSDSCMLKRFDDSQPKPKPLPVNFNHTTSASPAQKPQPPTPVPQPKAVPQQQPKSAPQSPTPAQPKPATPTPAPQQPLSPRRKTGRRNGSTRNGPTRNGSTRNGSTRNGSTRNGTTRNSSFNRNHQQQQQQTNSNQHGNIRPRNRRNTSRRGGRNGSTRRGWQNTIPRNTPTTTRQSTTTTKPNTVRPTTPRTVHQPPIPRPPVQQYHHQTPVTAQHPITQTPTHQVHQQPQHSQQTHTNSQQHATTTTTSTEATTHHVEIPATIVSQLGLVTCDQCLKGCNSKTCTTLCPFKQCETPTPTCDDCRHRCRAYTDINMQEKCQKTCLDMKCPAAPVFGCNECRDYCATVSLEWFSDCEESCMNLNCVYMY